MESASRSHIAQYAAFIVTAYVEKNPVARGSLPDLIESVGRTLSMLQEPLAAARLVPAVNPKRSVHADYIISLENGKKYQSLKRHLRSLSLTPQEYRQKWNLPDDYPIVAPNLTARRSEIAKRTGLGRTPHLRARQRVKVK